MCSEPGQVGQGRLRPRDHAHRGGGARRRFVVRTAAVLADKSATLTDRLRAAEAEEAAAEAARRAEAELEAEAGI